MLVPLPDRCADNVWIELFSSRLLRAGSGEPGGRGSRTESSLNLDPAGCNEFYRRPLRHEIGAVACRSQGVPWRHGVWHSGVILFERELGAVFVVDAFLLCLSASRFRSRYGQQGDDEHSSTM